jgi:hypothetical protein
MRTPRLSEDNNGGPPRQMTEAPKQATRTIPRFEYSAAGARTEDRQLAFCVLTWEQVNCPPSALELLPP